MKETGLVIDSDLSCRAKNILELNGIKTFDQVANVSNDELLTFKNMGKTTIREIRNYLKRCAFSKTEIDYVVIDSIFKERVIRAEKWFITDGCLVFHDKYDKPIMAYSRDNWIKIEGHPKGDTET